MTTLTLYTSPQRVRTVLVPAAAVWNVIIALASLALTVLLFQGDQFLDLGAAVQYALAVVAFVPAVLAGYASYRLLRGQHSGRLLSAALHFVMAVLAGAVLLNLWGAFIGLDNVAAAIFANAIWLWGIAAAYLVYWIAGRFDEKSSLRLWVERAGLGLGMLSLVLLLLTGNAVGAVLAVLGTYANPATWLATAAVVISAYLAVNLLQAGRVMGETQDDRTAWQGWLLVSPNIIGFMLFFAGPLLLSFYLSFTNSTGVTTPDFIGLSNYQDILSLEIQTQEDLDASPQDALSFGYVELFSFEVGGQRTVVGTQDFLFWRSLRNTIVYCVFLVPLSMLPALLLAMILNSSLPGMRFFRALYFLPSVAAVVGTALIWRWLYNTQVGYINYAISQVVNFFNGLFGLELVDPAIEWLANPNYQLVAIVILGAWQVMGFNTVLFLAGLQGIPRELYEAAFVDGAGLWQRFRKVTLPLLAPTTFFVAVTTIINGLQVFNEPYALIPSRPMPLDATTSVYYLYTRGFFRFEFGYASSVAWLLFALIFVVTLFQFRIQRATAYEN